MRSQLRNKFQIKTNPMNNQVKKFMGRRLSWLSDFFPAANMAFENILVSAHSGLHTL